MSAPSAPAAPPLPRIDLQLAITRPSGEVRTVDLATRALVVAVVPPPRWGREAEVLAGVAGAAEAGADVVEVPADPRLLGPAAAQGGLPVTARVETPAAADAALAAGAAFVLVPHDRVAELLGPTPAPPHSTAAAGATGMPSADSVASSSVAATGAAGMPSAGSAGGAARDVAGADVAGTAATHPGGRRGRAPELAAPGNAVVLVDTARAGRDAVDADPTRPVALDVVRLAGADAVSEESLALAVGVRLIRTADLRRTRRVIEVMAHLLEARR